MTDYDALKRHGHSAAKAAEIALDAKRGCKIAATWIKAVRRPSRRSDPLTPTYTAGATQMDEWMGGADLSVPAGEYEPRKDKR